MARVYGTYMKEEIERFHNLAEKDGFVLEILHGVENFNLKEFYIANVSTQFSCRTGYRYDNYDEAFSEGMSLLDEVVLEFRKEMDDLDRLYKEKNK